MNKLLQARPPVPSSLPGKLASIWRNISMLTFRNLVHIAREPLSLSDVTIQPILFTLLFVSIIGAAFPVSGSGSYSQFAIPGMILFSLITSSMGTGVGLSNDLNTGVIDRFRTLPMWSPAVLVARSISDILSSVLCVGIVMLTGLAIGWRPDASWLSVIGGVAVVLLFGYAISWGCACLGLTTKNPETAQGIGLVILFPMALVSNAVVSTQGMKPTWLQTIANWNPVSAVTSACRQLFGNPNPSSIINAWPMHHPVWAALIWSIGLLIIFFPTGAYLYRLRTMK
jgi:ABC transporter DrrB family efflux protein